ncbi:SGNH/GDSL hydrolase family protein [Rhodococcus qingshengii]|uniref:SGNH/GDSL hydrolase family protein n=1 Tax=Rhodococcus qingshengii TaxID=334542 RepID=UPI00287FD314|nr:SGNH/GDSL hydrolase family protein [Rhodococcus qingshengii]
MADQLIPYSDTALAGHRLPAAVRTDLGFSFAPLDKFLRATSPRFSAEVVMATPPTKTLVATSGPNPIASPQTFPFDTNRVTRLGLVPRVVNTGGGVPTWQENATNAAWTPPSFAVEFDFYGTSFAIPFKNRQANSAYFWTFVDGQPATAGPTNEATTSSGNFSAYYQQTFSAPAWRRIRVYMWLADFGGVIVGPTDSISPTRKPPVTVALYGDSWIDSATGAASVLTGVAHTAGRILGWELFHCGQGGTGYDNPGAASHAAYTDAARLDGLASTGADIVVISGSSNDDSRPVLTTQPAALYAAIAARMPKAKIIVVGPPSLGTTVPSGRAANVPVIKAAALAAPNVVAFIDPIAGTWITGTGKSGATTGVGNADIMVATDGIHPSQAGHEYYGRREAELILEVLRRYSGITLDLT